MWKKVEKLSVQELKSIRAAKHWSNLISWEKKRKIAQS